MTKTKRTYSGHITCVETFKHFPFNIQHASSGRYKMYVKIVVFTKT